MYTLYFAYAVYGFAFSFMSLSIQFELVNTYHYTPSRLAIIWSTVSLPWGFKPVYGYISDRVGRRMCISLGAFLAGILLFALSYYEDNISVGLSITSLCICFADVASDSIVVTHTKLHDKTLQSTCWTSRAFGSMIGTGLSGIAYETIGYSGVMCVSAIGPFLLSILIWNIKEPNINVSPLSNAVHSVWSMRYLVLITVFMGLIPEVNNVFFFTLKDLLQPVELSIISVASSCSACITSFMFQYIHSFEKPLYTATVLGILSCILAFATYMGAPPFGTEIVRGIIGGCAGMLFVLPLVIEAAKLSTDGAEGVSYAMFVSIMNLSGVIGEYIEGGVVKELNDMGLFLIVAAVVSWLPILVIHLHSKCGKD
jgi:MFS family permease